MSASEDKNPVLGTVARFFKTLARPFPVGPTLLLKPAEPPPPSARCACGSPAQESPPSGHPAGIRHSGSQPDGGHHPHPRSCGEPSARPHPSASGLASARPGVADPVAPNSLLAGVERWSLPTGRSRLHQRRLSPQALWRRRAGAASDPAPWPATQPWPAPGSGERVHSGVGSTAAAGVRGAWLPDPDGALGAGGENLDRP